MRELLEDDHLLLATIKESPSSSTCFLKKESSKLMSSHVQRLDKPGQTRGMLWYLQEAAQQVRQEEEGGVQ